MVGYDESLGVLPDPGTMMTGNEIYLYSKASSMFSYRIFLGSERIRT
jgi:hypothetical protein